MSIPQRRNIAVSLPIVVKPYRSSTVNLSSKPSSQAQLAFPKEEIIDHPSDQQRNATVATPE
jgi:hypothetical protein